MNKLIVTAVATLFAANLAFAQTPAAAPAKSDAKPAAAAPAAPSMPAAAAAGGNCEAQAVGKDGKPLHGAAKSAFMKKCTGEAGPAGQAKGHDCEAKAVSKAGKPLHGAAKDKFMKKCEADAKMAK